MLPCCPHALSSSEAFLVWPESGLTKDSMWSFVLIWYCAIPILWHLSYFSSRHRSQWLVGRVSVYAPWCRVERNPSKTQHQYTAQPDELVLFSRFIRPPLWTGTREGVTKPGHRGDKMKTAVCWTLIQLNVFKDQNVINHSFALYVRFTYT